MEEGRCGTEATAAKSQEVHGIDGGCFSARLVVDQKLRPLGGVEGEIKSFSDRVKWRWVFRHSQSTKPSITFKSRTPCMETVDGGLQCWLDRLRKRLVQDARQAIKKATWIKRRWSNATPLIRWGLRLLRDSNWKALPTDKTGSFVLVQNLEEAEIHQKVFEKSMWVLI